MTPAVELLALLVLVAVCVVPALKVRRDEGLWRSSDLRRWRR